MICMGNEKIKKSLYLPAWIVEMLNSEGEIYDGPGVVTGAAILALCDSPQDEKTKIIQRYREKEVSEAYQLSPAEQATRDVKEALAAKKRKSAGKKR